MTSVAAGLYHSLALGSDGRAYAWGSNDSGELGDGTSGYFAYRSHAAPVIGFPDGVSVASISAGAYHSLAVDAEGKAYAWGYNYNGQLGDGGSANRSTPVRVHELPGGDSVRHLAGGGFHTLAVAASPPVSPPDARRALLLSGGLAPAESGEIARFDAPPDGAVTIVEAVSALRRARQP
jgi:alpha-tubulin suppressor-like RCC1 family protein